jgi:hypothetical protein
VDGRRSILLLLLASVLFSASCGSSGKSSSATSSATSSNATATSGAPTTSAGGRAAALPAPCTLLTTDDVVPLLGTAVDTVPTTGSGAPGAAQCTYERKVGATALNIAVWTRDDFAKDPSFVFPSTGTRVNGLGDVAYYQSSQAATRGQVWVRLGSNAIQVTVSLYDKPIDESFVEGLARKAVSRV